MVLFILFPGFESSDKAWSFYYDNDKKIIADFITPLKKIGDVYSYTPKYYNLLYYRKESDKRMFDSDIDFDFKYLDIESHVELIYEIVKAKYKPPYVPIGHSIGNHYALAFAKKYESECLFTVSLDGSVITKKNVEESLSIPPKVKEYNIKNNDELQKLLKNRSEDDIQKILMYVFYNNFLWIKKNKIEKIIVPLITFRTIEISEDNERQQKFNKSNVKMYNEQQILETINNENAKIRYFVNATHFVWEKENYKKEIIDTIAEMIQKSTKKFGSTITIKTFGKTIIHVSGVQGSGKSTLGKIVKQKYGDRIFVEDLDDTRNKAANNDFKTYLENHIESLTNEIILFVGLNAEMCLGEMNGNDQTFYDFDTKFKYFINEDDNAILKQRWIRQIEKLNVRKEVFFDIFAKNNNITDKIIRYVNLEQWKNNNALCSNIHKKHNYEFLRQTDILAKIDNIIKN